MFISNAFTFKCWMIKKIKSEKKSIWYIKTKFIQLFKLIIIGFIIRKIN